MPVFFVKAVTCQFDETKHAYSDTTKPSSTSIPSRFQSPEVKPTSAIPVGSGTISPLLEALSSNAFNSSTAQNTNDWARNVPAFSESPGNLISLSGSPPTLPSSYEDRSILAGWNQRERGASNGHLPSASPPTQRRRPLSYQMDGNPTFEDQASQKMGYMYRRSSMYSQQAQRYGPNPPLPHQPQAHFYGAPEPNFGLPARAFGVKPGARGYYCGFDSLNTSGPGGPKPVDTVCISGQEGSLDVHSISKHGLKKIASLDNLSGGVYHAKVLPWTVLGGSQPSFPLIAVVLHGPVLHSSDATIVDQTVQAVSEAGSVRRGGSVQGSPREFPTSPPSEINVSSITHYQTTVEVYSLSSKKHICTLLSLPKIPVSAPVTSNLFMPPQPAGALSISADMGNIVVASGTSGELWIYNQTSRANETLLGFRCVGKVWTTLSKTRVQDPPRSPDIADISSPFSEPQVFKKPHKTAIFSLKGRWLAYNPPSSTTQVPLRALVHPMVFTAKSPGLNTYAPPQVPAINCAVDMPEGETLLNRVAREATQAALKGAKWVGDQGYQWMNSIWNKATVTPNVNGPGTAGSYWPGAYPPQQDQAHVFPPTHGEALQHSSSSTDPALISILDIEKLSALRTTSSAVSPHPFATFKSPLGCSFIAFSPSGLALFTASGKGEVQFVWDLMRIQYTKSSVLQPPHLFSLPGQHVRQVAIFTRMTQARIVDVVWTTQHGDQIAMVTDRNTVHFWELPPSAFAWPPLRRRIRNPHQKVPASGEVVEASKSATVMATNAVSAVWSAAQPLIKRPRGLSGPGRPAISAASMTAQAGHGGKALANGISKSFGAATGTIESFYKSGENRLHLPRGAKMLNTGCIKWLKGKQRNYLAAVVDGVIMIYTIKQLKAQNVEKQHISIGRKPIKIELPLIPDNNLAPAVLRAMDIEDELDLTETDGEARWDFSRTSVVKADATSGTESSIPQAEIESNAPYQPFHTDRRVGLYVYATSTPQSSSPSVSALLVPTNVIPQQPAVATADAPWIFGKPINAVKLDIGPPQGGNDEVGVAEDHYALPTSAIERVMTKISEEDKDVEQIVITTRRRRGTARGDGETPGTGDDGFFEDDCEVLDFASQRV